MSYLSNYVKELFVHVFSQSSHKLESFSPLPLQIALSNFDKELRFVFDEDFSMDMQTEEECLNVVNCLSKVFFMTNQITYSTEEVERLSKLIPSWLYSTNEEQIVKWFQTTLNEAEQQLYLLQITSSLEFALGNFYLTKQKPCPFLLKDLILSKELKDLFGVEIMKFLSVLFGGPFTLNLRNLLWHGFVSEGELNKVYYSSMLFVLVYLTFHISNNSLLLRVKPRKLVNKTTEIQLFKSQFNGTILSPESMDEILSIFHQAPFIPSSIFFLFRFSLELYSSKRYGACVQLLLPRIESLLRHQFTWCNNCPNRVLTAESIEFYTTIDEVLKRSLTNGYPNRIQLVLGEQVMVLLMDLFVLLEGLRLRDHLSHGEMNSLDVDEYLAAIIVILSVLLSHQHHAVSPETFFQLNIKPVCDEHCICHNSGIFLTFYDIMLSYSSLFHPLSFAKRNALFCLHSCQSKNFDLKYDSLLFSTTSCHRELCDKLESITSQFLQSFAGESNDIATKIELFQSFKLNTLHRSHSNDVIIRRISIQVLKMKDNVIKNIEQKVGLYQARKMRSRQRKNFQRFVESFSVLTSSLKLISCLILCLIHQTEQLDCFSTRVLKSILQTSEKCANFTSIDVNKWDESIKLLTAMSTLLSP